MSRILKLKTPVLALVLGVTAEALSFVVAILADWGNRPDEPVLATRFIAWFHTLPDWFAWWFMRVFKPFNNIESFQAQFTWGVLFFLFAVAQWYLIFLVGIGLFRRLSRKAA